MCNYFNLFDMRNLLKALKDNYSNYFAHISKDGKERETLFEHTKLTFYYFFRLIKVNDLLPIIEDLIKDFVSKKYIKETREKGFQFIKKLLLSVPLYHDFGKINPVFQKEKLNIDCGKIQINGLDSNHSKISSLIFIMNFLQEANYCGFSSEEKKLNVFLTLIFSFIIREHHSSNLFFIDKFDYDSNMLNAILQLIKNDLFNPPDIIKQDENFYNLSQKIEKEFLTNDRLGDNFYKDFTNIFFLLKLNYSLLTSSDYYATSHFMFGWKEYYKDFGIIDDNLKSKIINNIKTSKEYNKEIYRILKENQELDFPNEKSSKNLNILRQKIALEVIKNIRNNKDKNIFYIEAPTGSGKTNLSILAACELLENNKNIKKIIYVFPYTTIITQTFNVLKETLGLEDSEIVQIHSKEGFLIENREDDKYGNEKKNLIDYLFINYPILLMSHIRFFDVLKTNSKESNYFFYRIANSLVIIDEIQTYPPKEWDKVVFFIRYFAKYFNVNFIIMSATLPKIDKLIIDNNIYKNEVFVNLISDKSIYFSNPNFKNRTEIDFSMLEDKNFNKTNKKELYEKLLERIICESEKYYKTSKHIHTIVEFIYKKTASEFFKLVYERENEEKFFDEIFILSGTILEPRRKEIIAKLKSEKYKHKKILLITTQVVEAGVDIDMDLGFKDSSLIDSDEQLNGRINRNCSKEGCKLFIFDLDSASVIYGKDYRYKILLDKDFNESYRNILKDKNFDLLYNKVIERRNKINESSDFINIKDYLNNINKLKFDRIDNEFRLIDNSISNLTVFVPISIPVRIEISKDVELNIFNELEISFLKKYGKYNDESKIDGKKIWELYCETIEFKNLDFIERKEKLIILQGLLSKFTFSISAFSNFLNSIGNAEMKYGFCYLKNPEDIYDYNMGIKCTENNNELEIW